MSKFPTSQHKSKRKIERMIKLRTHTHKIQFHYKLKTFRINSIKAIVQIKYVSFETKTLQSFVGWIKKNRIWRERERGESKFIFFRFVCIITKRLLPFHFNTIRFFFLLIFFSQNSQSLPHSPLIQINRYTGIELYDINKCVLSKSRTVKTVTWFVHTLIVYRKSCYWSKCNPSKCLPKCKCKCVRVERLLIEMSFYLKCKQIKRKYWIDTINKMGIN